MNLKSLQLRMTWLEGEIFSKGLAIISVGSPFDISKDKNLYSRLKALKSMENVPLIKTLHILKVVLENPKRVVMRILNMTLQKLKCIQ